MIKLYHYSHKNFKGYIEPKFFGEGNYSLNSKRLSEVKRSYFYVNTSGREYYFNSSQYRYTAEIRQADLYDISKDSLNLAGRGDIYSEAKKRGYKGVIGKAGYVCVVLFYRVKIKLQEALTKA